MNTFWNLLRVISNQLGMYNNIDGSIVNVTQYIENFYNLHVQ